MILQWPRSSVVLSLLVLSLLLLLLVVVVVVIVVLLLYVCVHVYIYIYIYVYIYIYYYISLSLYIYIYIYVYIYIYIHTYSLLGWHVICLSCGGLAAPGLQSGGTWVACKDTNNSSTAIWASLSHPRALNMYCLCREPEMWNKAFVGWHYLSNATCLTRSHWFCVFLVALIIMTIRTTTCHVWWTHAWDKYR